MVGRAAVRLLLCCWIWANIVAFCVLRVFMDMSGTEEGAGISPRTGSDERDGMDGGCVEPASRVGLEDLRGNSNPNPKSDIPTT